MQSASATFERQFGLELAEALGDGYIFLKSRAELRAPVPEGRNVLILSGSRQFSPLISLSFSFGKNFDAVREIEKLVQRQPAYCHIQQLSVNRECFKDLGYAGPYSWDIDLREPLPRTLLSEVVVSVREIAVRFFERFSNIQAARDAIASNDPWCFGGAAFWPQLLMLDLALNDIRHFEQWTSKLDTEKQQEARALLAEYKLALNNAS